MALDTCRLDRETIEKMNIRAVLFDMDGTLIDSEPIHQLALRDVLEVQGIQVEAAFLNALTGLPLNVVYERIVDSTGLNLPCADLLEAKHAAYARRRDDLLPRAGAVKALDFLQNKGIRFGVVSNSDRVLVNINLEAMGLTQAGQVTVSRNDVRFGKPDPEPYLRAAWLMGLPPSKCLVVEDSVPGANAGLAAGMRVIAWPESHMSDFKFPTGVEHADPNDLHDTLSRLLA